MLNRTTSDVLFHDEVEFRRGVNLVSLAVMTTGIEVLAYTLMDNHFHFVIRSDEAKAECFARRISQQYMSWRSRVPGIAGVGGDFLSAYTILVFERATHFLHNLLSLRDLRTSTNGWSKMETAFGDVDGTFLFRRAIAYFAPTLEKRDYTCL